jgi:DNA polymerase III delta prime subunit
MGKLSKKVLTAHVESECERRLIIDLGDLDPIWFSPLRSIKPHHKILRNPKGMLDLGHEYEQKVYNALSNFKYRVAKTKFNSKTNINEVETDLLTSTLLDMIYSQLVNHPINSFILLEHKFDIPKNYKLNLFPNMDHNSHIISSNSSCIPDMVIIGNLLNAVEFDAEGNISIIPISSSPGYFGIQVRELLPDFKLRDVPPVELAKRYGISVLDVKNTLPDKVGKRHFMEILFYMHVLSNVIADWGLSDKFFVRLDTNGIFPRVEGLQPTSFSSVYDLYRHIRPLGWDKTYLIYNQTRSIMAKWWAKAPLNIDDVPLNIQPNCGFCNYLEDCKESLGMNSINPADWDLSLIPYTSPSIIYQLKDKGFNTIGDVFTRIQSIPTGNTPEPIYAERALLSLRSQAIIANRLITPPIGSLYSATIPKYSSLTMIFCCENDPTNDRVFGIGYYLNFSVSPKLSYSLIFERWWQEWDTFLNTTPRLPIPQFQSLLNSFLTRTITQSDIQDLIDIFNGLGQNLVIGLKGSATQSGSIRQKTVVYYAEQWLNEGPDPLDEYKMTEKALIRLYHLLKLSNYLELHIATKDPSYNSIFAPELSIFYWAKEQLQNFSDLLERHYVDLLADPQLRIMLGDLIRWISPSESGVTHPYQPKKLYDLQNFVQTVIGFPGIINYTWHEIASKLFTKQYNSRMWLDHFNYLDYGNWLEYLHQLKFFPTKAKSKADAIKLQMFIKTNTIDRLRTHFQNQASDNISKHSKSISCEEYQNVQPFSPLHLIGDVWYLFSKLTGAAEEIEAMEIRSNFPEYSIAKLSAAEIQNLSQIPATTQKGYHYRFNLLGLSRNMKIKEGDFVLILPEELRDLRLGKMMKIWEVKIRDLIWDSALQGYQLTTDHTYNDLFIQYRQKVNSPKNTPTWYLYPSNSDWWTNKLQNPDGKGLLQNYNFGTSWLAERLALCWNLTPINSIRVPAAWQFESKEIYAYCPQLINQIAPNQTPITALITKISPSLDPSQQSAIMNSLNRYISGIQGPPGTGKSQTIAALIDEYISRAQTKQSCKILVTAFSYAAIRVIVEKLRRLTDNNNNPTIAARTQMIFIRSENQDAIDPVANLHNVDDLVRVSKSWKWNKKPTSPSSIRALFQTVSIIFANAHSLYHLKNKLGPDFTFDLIVIDEASQVPTDYVLASLAFIYSFQTTLNFLNATPYPAPKSLEIEDINKIPPISIIPPQLSRLVIVGDYNQLPPVQSILPPKRFLPILESLFSYYVKYHQIPCVQLDVNYRSHQDIVEFTKNLGIYPQLHAFFRNANRTLPISIPSTILPWIQETLEPSRIVMGIVHKRDFEIGISPLESFLVTNLVLEYYRLRAPTTDIDEIHFWEEQIGIVAPHNAQGRTVIQQIYSELTTQNLTKLTQDKLIDALKRTIYSVEKFQGSDRDLIIATIGVSDKDQLQAEESFIYDLNRFNVLTSRAKSKVILICSKNYLDYIPRDQYIMDYAARMRKYIYNFCGNYKNLNILNEKGCVEEIKIRWH